MKTKSRSILIGALTATASLILFAACSSKPPSGTTVMASAYQPGEPGGIFVHTYDTSATVTGIDPDKREMTLVTPDGTQSVYKAGPEVVNFDQIHIGDQVKTTIAQQLVVFMGADSTAEGQQVSAIALAPEGAKPGVVVADLVQVTAKVKSLDLKKHRATLLFPDGKTRTFDVRPDVDLTKVNPDDEVTFRVTQAVAIRVEKP